MLERANDNIILDYWIENHDGWVPGVKFLHERKVTWLICQRGNTQDINALPEWGHPSEEITWAIGKEMGLQLIDTVKPCKTCSLGKAKKAGASKTTVSSSIRKAEWLSMDINSSSTTIMDGKKHQLLIDKDSLEYAWSYFLNKNLS